MIEDGPMKDHINRDKDGVIMSEYTTYTIKDNMLVKETTVRKYFKRGDYVDSTTTVSYTHLTLPTKRIV